MRNILDFSSWPALLSTVMGLLVATLVMVGVRLVFMQTIQRRRERENRQINERLKTLIAAYKTLGGSFTGQLLVSPLHMRELRVAAQRTLPGLDAAPVSAADAIDPSDAMDADPDTGTPSPASNSSDRQRRIRDAVEAALSDVILLGTEEQVQLAATAANEMVAGRSVEVAQLVVSLRQFIRAALDLAPIATGVVIPNQGPLRPGGGSGGAAGKRGGNADRGAGAAGGRAGGGGGGGGMGAMALGAGVGAGAGADRVGGDTPGNGPP